MTMCTNYSIYIYIYTYVSCVATKKMRICQHESVSGVRIMFGGHLDAKSKMAAKIIFWIWEIPRFRGDMKITGRDV